MSLYLLVVALILKIIAKVDPFGIYGVLGLYPALVLHWLNLSFLNSAGTLSLTVWVNILDGVKNVKTVNKMKAPKIITIVIASIGLLCITVAMIFAVLTNEWTTANLLLNGVMAILSLVLLIFLIYTIPILNDVIEYVGDASKKAKMKRV